MKILPQAGDLVRPVFLELVQTTGNFSFMKILPQAGDLVRPVVTYNLWLWPTTYGCNSSFCQKWKILEKMENFSKNGKFWKKWKILEKLENSGKNGKFWKNGKYWKLAVGASEC